MSKKNTNDVTSSYTLNRKTYKKLKKYDRQQMEEFIRRIYISGFNDGKVAISNEIDMKDIEKVIGSIKGIGTVMKQRIMDALDRLSN